MGLLLLEKMARGQGTRAGERFAHTCKTEQWGKKYFAVNIPHLWQNTTFKKQQKIKYINHCNTVHMSINLHTDAYSTRLAKKKKSVTNLKNNL